MTGSGTRRLLTRRWWRRRPVRSTLLALLVTGSMLALTAGWLGGRVWQTSGHLTGAVALARQLGEQLRAGDDAQARRTLDALQRQTAAARAAGADPLWRLAAHAPAAGANLRAVRDVSVAVDELARRAFPELVEVPVDGLLPHRGRIDLTVLRRTADRVSAADAAVQRVRTAFRPPEPELVDSVRAAVRELDATLDRVARLTSAAHRATTLLPALLGGSGDRTYLLAFQNLAESRATGGMLGSFAVLRAHDGRIELTGQGSAAQMYNARKANGYITPILPLDPAVRGLYGQLPSTYPADVNLTPDFSTAARLYRAMYHAHTGRWVDGVLATDPVALSYLLASTGPVAVPGGPTLTSGTAVRALLSDVYLRMADEDDQDAYFADAARAVFDALLSRPVDTGTLLTALDRALDERRLLAWSAHPAEQAALAQSRIAGVLPDRETRPTVGVFLNDGSGAKLGYYLTRSAELTAGACRPGGWREWTLRATLGSTAPRSGLTPAVLGLGMAGDPYTTRTLATIYSPAGGSVTSAQLDGRRIGLGTGRERRRQVGIAVVDLRPGQHRVLEVGLLAPPSATGPADLWLGPGVTPWTTRISSTPSCDE